MGAGQGDSPLRGWGDDLRHEVVIEASWHESRTELWRSKGLGLSSGTCRQNNGNVR